MYFLGGVARYRPHGWQCQPEIWFEHCSNFTHFNIFSNVSILFVSTKYICWFPINFTYFMYLQMYFVGGVARSRLHGRQCQPEKRHRDWEKWTKKFFHFKKLLTRIFCYVQTRASNRVAGDRKPKSPILKNEKRFLIFSQSRFQRWQLDSNPQPWDNEGLLYHCAGPKFNECRGRIFSHVRPFYEQGVSDLDRSMHISLWV